MSSTPSLPLLPTLVPLRARKSLSSTSPLVVPTTRPLSSASSTSSPSPPVPRRPSLPRLLAETSATGALSLTTGTSASTPRPFTLVLPAESCLSRLIFLRTVPLLLVLVTVAPATAPTLFLPSRSLALPLALPPFLLPQLPSLHRLPSPRRARSHHRTLPAIRLPSPRPTRLRTSLPRPMVQPRGPPTPCPLATTLLHRLKKSVEKRAIWKRRNKHVTLVFSLTT